MWLSPPAAGQRCLCSLAHLSKFGAAFLARNPLPTRIRLFNSKLDAYARGPSPRPCFIPRLSARRWASHNPSLKIAKKSTECFQQLTRLSPQFCPKTEMSCCYPETEGWIAAFRLVFRPAAPPEPPVRKDRSAVQKEPPCCELRYRMKNDVTRSTATRPLPLPPVLPCDAYCKNHPLDASQNRDLSSQLTEKEQLKTPSLKTSHSPKTCVSRLRPLAHDPCALGPGTRGQGPETGCARARRPSTCDR